MVTELVDPMGLVVEEIRALPAVIAIVSDRAATDASPKDHQLQARVLLLDQGLADGLGRPGERRTGQQLARYIARCYGPSRDASGNPIATGAITARELAGAVAAGMHREGPRVGSGGRVLQATWVTYISPKLTDPDTEEPYYEVYIEAAAGAQRVAS